MHDVIQFGLRWYIMTAGLYKANILLGYSFLLFLKAQFTLIMIISFLPTCHWIIKKKGSQKKADHQQRDVSLM